MWADPPCFYTTELRVNTLENISPFYGFVSRKEGRNTMFSEIVCGNAVKKTVFVFITSSS